MNVTDSTKKILYLLRKSEGGVTIEELCKSLHVTPMAVHRPLTLLEDRGLVSSEILRFQKRGRPVRIYKLTEAADELFPKNYENLLLEVLGHLDAREGMSRIKKLFEACFKRSAETSREKMKGKDLRSRVEMLSGILNENNYMTEQKQINKDQFLIKMLNCPIFKVAKEYPQACSCEQHFLSDVLQANVERDHHILNGQNYCSYRIRRK
jgi:predicted ArsR family transcriptional regulator